MNLDQARTRPIVLAGTGRSGTSWLLDLLTSVRGYRAVFEPLHWYNVPFAKDYYDLYIDGSYESRELEQFFEGVFFGHPGKGWLRWMTLRTAQNESVFRMLGRAVRYPDRFKPFARNRVVKIIKGNLMLEWLAKTFDPTIVFLIRHPCAVVSSQRKMGWDSDLQRFLSQQPLMGSYLARQVELIKGATTEIEKLTIRWCIENYIPLAQMHDGTLKNRTFFFEHLVQNPEETLIEILRHMALPDRDVELFVSQMRKNLPPLPQTLSSWKKRMPAAEQDLILGLVQEFGISCYGTEPTPGPNLLAMSP